MRGSATTSVKIPEITHAVWRALAQAAPERLGHDAHQGHDGDDHAPKNQAAVPLDSLLGQLEPVGTGGHHKGQNVAGPDEGEGQCHDPRWTQRPRAKTGHHKVRGRHRGKDVDYPPLGHDAGQADEENERQKKVKRHNPARQPRLPQPHPDESETTKQQQYGCSIR